jgi:hypothetical protein
MKTTRRRAWLRILLLIAAFVCAGSWAASQVRSMRDRSEVAKALEHNRTVCVGRFLVDVPAQAEVRLSRGNMNGFDVDSVEESETKFRQRIKAREADIAAKSVEAGKNVPGGMIETRELHVPGMVGQTLMYRLTRSHGFEGGHRVEREYFSVEVHAHTNGVSFLLSMEYADEADVAAAEVLLAHVRLRAEHEVPNTLGFCIGHAVFVEPLPPHTTGGITMHIVLPGHRDMAIGLMSLPSGGAKPGLIARDARADAAETSTVLSRVTKLRIGRRPIHGIDGEEVLERIREFNFATTYGFMWESRGVENDPLQPFLTMELQTGISQPPGGQPVDSSLHEDALLTMWDSILSSIRLRKSGPNPDMGPRLVSRSPTVRQAATH